MSKTIPAPAPAQNREYFETQHRTQVVGLLTLHSNLAVDIDALENRNNELSNHAGTYGIDLSTLAASGPITTATAPAGKRGRTATPFLSDVRAYVADHKAGFTMPALIKHLKKSGITTKDDNSAVLLAARTLQDQGIIHKTKRMDGKITIYEAS